MFYRRSWKTGVRNELRTMTGAQAKKTSDLSLAAFTCGRHPRAVGARARPERELNERLAILRVDGRASLDELVPGDDPLAEGEEDTVLTM